MDTQKIKKNLQTQWLGFKIHFNESIDSTNTWAKKALRDGALRGEIFLTDHQTAGYGLKQRRWESPHAKNILMSLIDKAPSIEGQSHHLTLVAGLGVHEGLAYLFPTINFKLKWPNDILLHEKKLGGILCEQQQGQIIVGIGVNVNAVKEDFSLDIASKATSLCLALNKILGREQIISSILNSYEKWRSTYDKFGMEKIIKAWNEKTVLINRKVDIIESNETYTGIAEGIDEDGFLLVKVGDEVHQVISGDVILK